MAGQSVFMEPYPAAWRLDGSQEDRCVCFGRHRIAVADIVAVHAEEIRDRPLAGTILVVIVFVVIAAMLAFGVFEAEMRTRFLIGTALLGLLGFMSLSELGSMRQQRLFVVSIEQRDGDVATFSTAERGEAERLLAALSDAL